MTNDRTKDETPTLIAVTIVVDGQKAHGGLYEDIDTAKRFCAFIAPRLMPDVPTFELQTMVPDESKKRFPNDLVTYVPQKDVKPVEFKPIHA